MRKTRSIRMPTPIECPERIRSILASLEISTDLIAVRSLVLHPEAQELIVAEIGDDGREYLLALISRHFAAAAGASRYSRPSSPISATINSCASGCNTRDRDAIRSVDIARESRIDLIRSGHSIGVGIRRFERVFVMRA